MPVYYIQSQQVSNQKIEIEGPLAHHLGDSLRIKIQETLELVDEHQRAYRVLVTGITTGKISVEILRIKEPPEQRPVQIVLAQAMLKRARMEWLIQKATELGVTRIWPMVSERTVVRPPSRRETHQNKRWTTIAMEAAQQSDRLSVPEILPSIDYRDISKIEMDSDLKILLWEEEKNTQMRDCMEGQSGVRSVLLVVGPEGGLSSNETSFLSGRGFKVASLGKRVLRSETAALAALSILQYELTL